MTDEMRQYMREIVAAVTNQLANTPSKSDDPSGYPKLLKRLDVTLPRHAKRGSKPGVQPPQLKEYNHTRVLKTRMTEQRKRHLLSVTLKKTCMNRSRLKHLRKTFL